MCKTVVVVGVGGVLGGGVAVKLGQLGFDVVPVSAKAILNMSFNSLTSFAGDLVSGISVMSSAQSSVGLVLAHRCRSSDPCESISAELAITRGLTWALADLVPNLRVVVLGSVTGTFLCPSLPESYHYAKDMQKSIARQSLRLSNVQMNVVALSWFEKYAKEKQCPEYSNELARVSEKIGSSNLPSISDIGDFVGALLRARHVPRGQVINFDGGYSTLQE